MSKPIKHEPTTMIPAVVGVGSLDLGLLSVGSFSKGRRRREPEHVSWGGAAPYLVGDHVDRYTNPIERLDFDRLASGPELQALTYAALGSLVGEGETSANIMIGLPVELMSDKKQAKTTLARLRRWLVGDHFFELNGAKVDLHIGDISAIAQPAGAFFAWGLDPDGAWARPADDLNVPVGVADLGFNTLDLFAVEGGRVLGRYTSGTKAGMRRAAETLADQVNREYRVELSRQQADVYLRTPQARLATAGELVDLEPARRAALDNVAGLALAFLERQWGSGRQFGHVLLTGGGSQALGAALSSALPFAETLAEPVTANARGLARYGRRLWADVDAVIGLDPGFGGFKAVLS